MVWHWRTSTWLPLKAYWRQGYRVRSKLCVYILPRAERKRNRQTYKRKQLPWSLDILSEGSAARRTQKPERRGEESVVMTQERVMHTDRPTTSDIFKSITWIFCQRFHFQSSRTIPGYFNQLYVALRSVLLYLWVCGSALYQREAPCLSSCVPGS